MRAAKVWMTMMTTRRFAVPAVVIGFSWVFLCAWIGVLGRMLSRTGWLTWMFRPVLSAVADQTIVSNPAVPMANPSTMLVFALMMGLMWFVVSFLPRQDLKSLAFGGLLGGLALACATPFMKSGLNDVWWLYEEYSSVSWSPWALGSMAFASLAVWTGMFGLLGSGAGRKRVFAADMVGLVVLVVAVDWVWKAFPGFEDMFLAYMHHSSAFFGAGFEYAATGFEASPPQYGHLSSLIGAFSGAVFGDGPKAFSDLDRLSQWVWALNAAAIGILGASFFARARRVGVTAPLIFLALAYVCFHLPRMVANDPYFQSQPGRVLPAALAVALTVFVSGKMVSWERWKVWAFAFLLGFFPVLNAESGIAGGCASILTVAFVMGGSFRERARLFGEMAMFMAVGFGAFLFLFRAFFGAGVGGHAFWMSFGISAPAPMEAFSYPLGVFGAVFLALTVSAARFSGQRLPTARVAEFASMAAAILLSTQYFVRPMVFMFLFSPMVFVFAAWAAWALRTERAVFSGRAGWVSGGFAAVALAVAVFLGAGSIGMRPGSVSGAATPFAIDKAHRMNGDYSAHEEAARKHLKSGEKYVFITDSWLTLTWATGAVAQPGFPRFPENFDKPSWTRLIRALAMDKDKVFVVSKAFLGFQMAGVANTGGGQPAHRCVRDLLLSRHKKVGSFAFAEHSLHKSVEGEDPRWNDEIFLTRLIAPLTESELVSACPWATGPTVR